MSFALCDFNNYKAIICVELKENFKTKVINASELIYDFDIIGELPEINLDDKISYSLEGIKVRFNKKDYPFSLGIKPNINKNLLFVLPSTEEPESFLQYEYLYGILSPVLERFSRVIEFEQIYKNSRRRNLREIKDKLFYIRKAEKAMHFIKNKLSPMDNLIAVLKEQHIEKENVVYEDEYIKDFILKELKKSDTNLEKIINTATVILNKENNPFTFSKLKRIRAVDIFWVIDSLSDDFFNGTCSIIFNWDIDNIFSNKLEYNKEGLYILLTDWFSNMSKYGTDYLIEFSEDQNVYKIIFSNLYDEESKDQVLKIESDFNLNDRKEIIRRRSHGIYQIKSTMEEMNLNGRIRVDDNKIYFTIEFKKIAIDET